MTIIIENNHLAENHSNFLFQNVTWEGYGTVIIFQTGAVLHFKVTQKMEIQNENSLKVLERVTFQESEESWDTNFHFHFVENNNFLIELDNITLGHLNGKGELTEKEVHWKMCDENGNTIGKTHYIKLENGSYLINSAYKLHGMTQLSISGIISKSTE